MLQNLTKTEIEVIKLKCKGLINKEIADIRCNSVFTIKNHIKNALKKTRYRSSAELFARYAQSNINLFNDYDN